MNTYCFVKYIFDLYGVYINIYIYILESTTIKITLYKENCFQKGGTGTGGLCS